MFKIILIEEIIAVTRFAKTLKEVGPLMDNQGSSTLSRG